MILTNTLYKTIKHFIEGKQLRDWESFLLTFLSFTTTKILLDTYIYTLLIKHFFPSVVTHLLFFLLPYSINFLEVISFGLLMVSIFIYFSNDYLSMIEKHTSKNVTHKIRLCYYFVVAVFTLETALTAFGSNYHFINYFDAYIKAISVKNSYFLPYFQSIALDTALYYVLGLFVINLINLGAVAGISGLLKKRGGFMSLDNQKDDQQTH